MGNCCSCCCPLKKGRSKSYCQEIQISTISTQRRSRPSRSRLCRKSTRSSTLAGIEGYPVRCCSQQRRRPTSQLLSANTKDLVFWQSRKLAEEVGDTASETIHRPYRKPLYGPEITLSSKKSQLSFGVRLEEPIVSDYTLFTIRESFDPSPEENCLETLVSDVVVVQLRPHHLPNNLHLMHSGPKTAAEGFENMVKCYDYETKQWEQVSDFRHIDDYLIEIPLTKPTAVAVVSRLIINAFEVPVSGCVVRSSVWRDVTLCFPEGAVDVTVKGRLKMLPMPNNFQERIDGYPCVLLVVDGFEGITFSEPVTITIPHPIPAKYPVGRVHLMCLKENNWEDISNERGFVGIEKETTIELRVRHFSDLWPWITVPAAAVSLAGLSIYGYVCRAPHAIFFAAFKMIGSPKIILVCVENHRQDKIDEKSDYNCKQLAGCTANKGIRPDSKAFLAINECCFDVPENFYLQFIKGQKCRKELLLDDVKRPGGQTANAEKLCLSFYEDEDKKTLLCELKFYKDQLFVDETIASRKVQDSSLLASAPVLSSPPAPQSSDVYGDVYDLEAGISRSTTRRSDESNDHDTDDKLAGRIVLPLRVLPLGRPDNFIRLPMDHPDSRDVYKMKSSPRGLLVIINMERFTVDPDLADKPPQLPERKGSEKDEQELTDLFGRYLDFKVLILRDKKRLELLTELRKLSENGEYRQYDCLAVCIMSHGEKDFFYASDGRQVKVKQVYTMFNNADCKAFREKPKLFFIQACRGTMKGGVAEESTEPAAQAGAKKCELDMFDMLIAYSSFEGCAAYRDQEEGSFFIQCLVNVFRQYAVKEDMMSMITRVNQSVSDCTQGSERIQVPTPIPTLRKKLYFWPRVKFDKDLESL